MKRLLTAACILLLLCCSCGKQEIDGGEKSEPVTLTFMMPQSHDMDFLEKLLDEFESENESIRIEVQRIPDNQWIDVVRKSSRGRDA